MQLGTHGILRSVKVKALQSTLVIQVEDVNGELGLPDHPTFRFYDTMQGLGVTEVMDINFTNISREGHMLYEVQCRSTGERLDADKSDDEIYA